ncbi:MAG: acyl-[acyl-carrier-protein]--UDP-N-acetylglucosamine O-acyltransferase [Bacteroidetes bacterium]|nr:MAG: acyl-[acyl-carrier-protein]--UDP-N-acetylglucosamine O-acyltransferase [Bacteroidota bacterium]
MSSLISPQAFVHEKASIGENVVIEPFSFIGPNVTIGDRTHIGPNVSIIESTSIGKDCKIFSGAVIGAEPQDLKFDNELTTVEIGDRTIIRECVTIHRATSDRLKTVVGDDCLIMAYVHIAHDVKVGNHVILANAVNVAGHVTIDDWVIVEGMVGIQQFVRIGEHAFVAGGSLVRKNIPPYIKAAREPLSYIGVNSIGLRRRGFDLSKIQRIEDIYRTLYVQNANMSQALKVADAEFPACVDKDFVLGFIRESDKGIIRGPF